MGEGVEVNGIDISTDASDAGEAGQGRDAGAIQDAEQVRAAGVIQDAGQDRVSGAHESAETAGNADEEVEF